MAKVTRKRELKVCFDTNVLFTQVASDLLRKQVADLLSVPVNDPNLSVKWFLPEMVRDEREYQMRQKAQELLPSLSKLERVIGHGLGITPEILKDRIAATIAQQLNQYGLTLLPLDSNTVDWGQLIQASVNRSPPFDAGEKEKGFRDAVIVETFMQEVKRSPKTSSTCILAIVSEDALVRDAVRTKATGATNVRILTDLEELTSLVNTLASEVSEEYVAELQPKAGAMFFTNSDDKTTLWYTWDLDKSARERFKDALAEKPPGITRVTNKGNFITLKPQFVSKAGQVITWQSLWRVNQELWGPRSATAGNVLSTQAAPQPIQAVGGLLGLSTAASTDEVISTRDLRFHIRWSTRVNARKMLSSPKLEDITEALPEPGK
jgi:PIN domain